MAQPERILCCCSSASWLQTSVQSLLGQPEAEECSISHSIETMKPIVFNYASITGCPCDYSILRCEMVDVADKCL